MFILVIFLTQYVFTGVCNCASIPHNGKENEEVSLLDTTKKKLQDEMDSFEEVLGNLKDNTFNLGKLLGKFEEKMKQKIELEQTVNELKTSNAQLEKDKIMYEEKMKQKIELEQTINKLKTSNARLEKDKIKLELENNRTANMKIFVQRRSATEKFEHDYGADAEIDYKLAPKSNMKYEKSRFIRRERWIWILNNVYSAEVDQLRQLIDKSPIFGGNYTDFAECMAVAFTRLSEIIHYSVLTPGGGDVIHRHLTSNVRVNRAMEVFMEIFEITDHVVELRTTTLRSTSLQV